MVFGTVSEPIAAAVDPGAVIAARGRSEASPRGSWAVASRSIEEHHAEAAASMPRARVPKTPGNFI